MATASRAEYVRLNPVLSWVSGIASAAIIVAGGSAAAFAWSANAHLAAIDATLGQLAGLIADHENRIRSLERGS